MFSDYPFIIVPQMAKPINPNTIENLSIFPALLSSPRVKYGLTENAKPIDGNTKITNSQGI